MLQNHSPFVAVMKSFSLAHPKIFFTYFFVFPAAPISVNPPPHPPIVVFLFFLSLLLLISPAAPWVYWCLCFLIFNLGLCFLFVCFFFLLLLQYETFLDFSPSQFISHSSVFCL